MRMHIAWKAQIRMHLCNMCTMCDHTYLTALGPRRGHMADMQILSSSQTPVKGSSSGQCASKGEQLTKANVTHLKSPI